MKPRNMKQETGVGDLNKFENINKNREKAFVYAFLSRCYQKELDSKAIKDLKENKALLEAIGENTQEWFLSKSIDEIKEALNIDYSSAFMLNSQPVETLIEDSKGEILVGLQNPVMQFYFNHGYEINMNQTDILAPDHLSIELGFMQNLYYKDEEKIAFMFLREHLLKWVPPYLIGIKSLVETPFFNDLIDFTNEFLLSDYEEMKEKYKEEIDERV